MHISLTPAEFADVIAGATRDESGMVLLEIPDESVGRDAPRLVLAHPNVVRFDRKHAKLTPTQHALVRLVQSRGAVDFDEARNSVWMWHVSDKRIANTCSEISVKLADAGIPVELSCAGSMVSIREIRNPGNPG